MFVPVAGTTDISVPVNTATGLSATTVDPVKSPGSPFDSRLKTSNGPSVTVTSPFFGTAGKPGASSVGVDVRIFTDVPSCTPTTVMYARRAPRNGTAVG